MVICCLENTPSLYVNARLKLKRCHFEDGAANATESISKTNLFLKKLPKQREPIPISFTSVATESRAYIAENIWCPQ